MATQELVFSPPRPLVARIWPMLLVFVGYLVVSHVGLVFAVLDGIATPAWGPAGIGVAALTLGGRRLWPAVFAATFIVYAVNGAALPLAAIIAIGNTLAVIAGAAVLGRLDFSPALDRMRDIGRLAIAGAACASVGSVVGVTALWTTGEIPGSDIAYRLSLWWTGDFTSVCIVAAAIFTVAASIRSGRVPTGQRGAELVTVLASLAIIVTVVFSDESRRFPAFTIPFWAWATLRFRALGGSLATLIVVGIGQYFTVSGEVLIDGATTMRNVQASQTLPAIVGLCLLLLAAALTERDDARAVAERALRDEQKIASRLRQIDESKDRMLAAVSHELSTPLTSILGLSQLLHQGTGTFDDDKQREMLGRLESEAVRLDVLLADLLDVERLRLGMIEPRYEAIDLAALVRSTIDGTPAKRHARLELESVRIEADAAKVERIVDNLVSNANKHTHGEGQITVAVRAFEDGALITVDDDGAGVPDEYKVSVFEPFERGTAELAEVPGTGIGLSLVKHFTELHGGRTWVEDRPSGGASFRVFLPSARA